MLRYNPWARSLYERLTGGQKTRKKKAIVAVARKLLVRCWVMLLRNEPWRQRPGSRRQLQWLFHESSVLESGVGFAFRFGFGTACSSELMLIQEIG